MSGWIRVKIMPFWGILKLCISLTALSAVYGFLKKKIKLLRALSARFCVKHNLIFTFEALAPILSTHIFKPISVFLGINSQGLCIHPLYINSQGLFMLFSHSIISCSYGYVKFGFSICMLENFPFVLDNPFISQNNVHNCWSYLLCDC